MLSDIDLVQTNSLSDILNVTLTGDSWRQASLPAHWGGIGVRGISCKKSAGLQYRQHAVNDIISRTFRSIDVSAVLEPPVLLRGDGKRLDGTTLIP